MAPKQPFISHLTLGSQIWVRFLAAIWLSGLSAPAFAAPRYAFEARVFARHARQSDDFKESSDLLKLDLTQKARWSSSWSGSLGLREEVEGVYAAHPERFTGEATQKDTTTAWPRET